MHCINCGKENDENNQFCMYCGAELFKAGKKGVDGGVVVQQKEATGTVSRPGKLNKIDQQKLLIGIVAVVLVLVVAVCFWAGAATTIIRLFWPAEQLVYTVQEDRGEITTAIMTIRADGKDNREIYSDNDGFMIDVIFREGSYFSADSMAAFVSSIIIKEENTFSPDGKTIALIESTGDILLLNKEVSSQVSVAGGDIFFIFRGFSPDGKYFGFTDLDDGTPTLRIVDLSGKEVFSADNRYFGDFLPDSQKLVVVEDDSDKGAIGLGLLDITSGEYTYLTNIEEEKAARLQIPRVSPDGRTIYYVDGNNVMSIPSKGGASASLYESDEGALPLIAIGTRTLAVIDSEEDSLYLVDVRKGTKTRVAKDLVNVVVSPNEKYMAYVTDAGNDEEDLYLAKADGSDRIRLSKNTNWFSFSFSPNKKHLAYIEGNSSSDGGSLYIVRLDGSESQRLDTGVWSFRFVEGGDYVVYVKVDDMDRGDPESEIYRIRTDGQKKSLILQADDGLFSFIWPGR